MTINITRAKLEQLVGELVEGTLGPVKQALQDAGADGGADRRGRAGRRPDAHAAGAGFFFLNKELSQINSFIMKVS